MPTHSYLWKLSLMHLLSKDTESHETGVNRQHTDGKLLAEWAETMQSSVSTGPGPGPGPLQSNITSVWSRNIFWTGLSPCAAFALLFLFTSYKPHFTLATKKESSSCYCYHTLHWRTVNASMQHFQHKNFRK